VQSVFSLGLFGNRAMNIWAFAAMAFLLVTMYVPGLQARFGMSPIPLPRLLMVAALALAVPLLAELAKRWVSSAR
jgi:hypothetical protein